MKKSKSTIFAILAIAIVLLAILNIVSFAVPLPKQDPAVFYTAYGFAEGVLVLGAILSLAQLGHNTPNQRVLGLPIAYSGSLMVLFQVILTAVFYLVNAFVKMPMWVVVVVECLLLGVFAVQIIFGFFFKAKTAEYQRTTANTTFMDEFRARIKSFVITNKNENLTKELEELNDAARCSDPVSNEKTTSAEDILLNLVGDLDRSLKEGHESEAREVIASIRDALAERNVYCKAGK